MIWALTVGLALVLWAWFVVAEYLNVPGVVRFFLYALVYLVAFRFAIAISYVFPYLAKFEGTTREVIRNARIMSLRHLFSSFAILLVVGLPVVITIFFPELSGYGMLWLAFGFAGIAYVNAYLLRAIFAKYIPAEPDPVTPDRSGESQGVS